jgi:hypothetical protein
MKAAERFLVNFYEWCLAETEREVRGDLPCLLRLKNSNAAKYIRFLSSVDPASRLSRATALVKRFSLPALKLKNEVILPEEQYGINGYLHFGEVPMPFGVPINAASDRSAAVLARATIDRKALRNELKKRLGPLLGEAESFGKGEWRYSRTESRLRIVTCIDTGGRLPLGYSHRVLTSSGGMVHHWISLLQWHGIASGTDWDLMSGEDVVSSADLVAELCDRFLAAIPKLVS